MLLDKLPPIGYHSECTLASVRTIPTPTPFAFGPSALPKQLILLSRISLEISALLELKSKPNSFSLNALQPLAKTMGVYPRI